MKCPDCQIKVPKEYINVQTDIAHCQSCGKVFNISKYVVDDFFDKQAISVNKNTSARNFDMNNPPKGAWINHLNDGVSVGSTTRSWIALFLVPFSLVWSGGALGGIYGSQIISGEFNIISSLFGIPFLLGSVLLWSFTLMSIFGKIEVTLKPEGGYIFTGIGKIGYHQHFKWNEIDTVKEEEYVTRTKNGGTNRNHRIALEGQRRLTFGTYLSEDARYYIYHTLKQLIENRK